MLRFILGPSLSRREYYWMRFTEWLPTWKKWRQHRWERELTAIRRKNARRFGAAKGFPVLDDEEADGVAQKLEAGTLADPMAVWRLRAKLEEKAKA